MVAQPLGAHDGHVLLLPILHGLLPEKYLDKRGSIDGACMALSHAHGSLTCTVVTAREIEEVRVRPTCVNVVEGEHGEHGGGDCRMAEGTAGCVAEGGERRPTLGFGLNEVEGPKQFSLLFSGLNWKKTKPAGRQVDESQRLD